MLALAGVPVTLPEAPMVAAAAERLARDLRRELAGAGPIAAGIAARLARLEAQSREPLP